MNKIATMMPLSSRLGLREVIALHHNSHPESMRRTCTYLRRSGRIALDVPSLVHETCLRFGREGVVTSTPRKQLLGNASRVVRAAIVDYPYERKALQLSDSATILSLKTSSERVVFVEDSISPFNDVFKGLKEIGARSHHAVKMRCFDGLVEEEISDFLDGSVTNVKRCWREARAFQFDTIGNPVP